MRKKKTFWTTNNIVYAVVIFAVIFFMLRGYCKDYLIASCSYYTIAKPNEVSGGFKTGYGLHYSFKWKGVGFTGQNGIKKDYMENNDYLIKRYWVKFYCSDPTISEIIWDVSVPDSIVHVPEIGWEQLPYGLEKK